MYEMAMKVVGVVAFFLTAGGGIFVWLWKERMRDNKAKLDNLITDVKELKNNVASHHTDIEVLKEAKVGREELKATMEETRHMMDEKVKQLREDIKEDINEVKADVKDTKNDIKAIKDFLMSSANS